MVRYAISTHNYIGSGPTIVALEGTAEIPAVIISQLNRDSPLNTAVVARNMVSLLNGNSASEKSPFAGRSIQYVGLPGSVVLNFRDENGGVSKEGLQITLNRAAPDHIVAELESVIDADFMKKVCDTVPALMPGAPSPSTHQQLGR